MPCRIIHDLPADQIQSLPWLEPSGPKAPQVRRRAADFSDEALQFQAQLAEMAAASDQRAGEAHAQGFREGEEAARKNMEAGYRAAVERLAAAITDLTSARTDMIRRLESDTVRLAIEIARRVLHRELAVDPSALEGLIKAALEKLSTQEILRVRVHPDQEKLLIQCIQRTGKGSGIEILSDLSQPRGGAIFEVSRGAMDATVETQLREIERGLTDEIKNR